MSDVFLDIHIALPPDEYIREILPGVISDLGFEGFVEDDRVGVSHEVTDRSL